MTMYLGTAYKQTFECNVTYETNLFADSTLPPPPPNCLFNIFCITDDEFETLFNENIPPYLSTLPLFHFSQGQSTTTTTPTAPTVSNTPVVRELDLAMCFPIFEW